MNYKYASNYGDAIVEWRKEKEEFIEKSHNFKERSKVSPRLKLAYAVPEIYRKEADAFIASLRERADKEFLGPSGTKEEIRKALSLEFEKANPPPAVNDFA